MSWIAGSRGSHPTSGATRDARDVTRLTAGVVTVGVLVLGALMDKLVDARLDLAIIVFVAVVSLVATFLGSAAAWAAAITSTAVIFYLFMEPKGELALPVAYELAMLAAFLVAVAVVVRDSERMSKREREAARAAQRTRLLSALALGYAVSGATSDPGESLGSAISGSLGVECAMVIVRPRDGEPAVLAHTMACDLGSGHVDGEVAAALKAWEEEYIRATPHGLETPVAFMQDRGSVLIAAVSRSRVEGGLLIDAPEDEAMLSSSDTEALVAAARLFALQIEAARLEEERLRLGAAQEVESMRATVVSAISHELKTPITVMRVALEALRPPSGQTSKRSTDRDVDAALQALGRLESLAGGLLDTAVMDTAGWQSAVEACDLGEMVGSALYALPAAQRERVVIEFGESVAPVQCDPSQAVRVIGILLGNALAYADAGTPVTVGAAERAGCVELYVRDVGPGVHPDERESVFERMRRGRASSGVPGSGLGLAIARQIARFHGGDVTLDDSYDSGARFVLTLPTGARDEETR